MTEVLVGIDDTDNADSRGTGFLARSLAAECERRGCSVSCVTRHQLLVDPRIPYTSHNSSACLGLTAAGGTASLAFAFGFVATRSAEGSDPALCVAAVDAVTAAIRDFGRRARSQIVDADEALRLAREAAVDLRPLGGTGLGVIGALSAVGLRHDGNDGRYIDMPGLRELPQRVAASDLVRMGIRLEHRGGRTPGLDDPYETLGWVRPNLMGGASVLPVIWSVERNAWLPVERKHGHAVE